MEMLAYEMQILCLMVLRLFVPGTLHHGGSERLPTKQETDQNEHNPINVMKSSSQSDLLQGTTYHCGEQTSKRTFRQN